MAEIRLAKGVFTDNFKEGLPGIIGLNSTKCSVEKPASPGR